MYACIGQQRPSQKMHWTEIEHHGQICKQPIYWMFRLSAMKVKEMTQVDFFGAQNYPGFDQDHYQRDENLLYTSKL